MDFTVLTDDKMTRIRGMFSDMIKNHSSAIYVNININSGVYNIQLFYYSG
jgi:hypothetical protein